MPPGSTSVLSPDFRKKLEYLRVVARRLQTGRFAALQRAKRLGRGIEFVDHRPYSPGDEFKDIDWNLYGRLDRFLVRLAREETELNLHILVDSSSSMTTTNEAGLSKADLASQIATALSYIALSQLDRVHIHPFDQQLKPPLRPKRHKASAARVERFLAEVTPPQPTDLFSALRAFALSERTKGIALVLSDFLDSKGWRKALDLVRSSGFDLGILQIVSPEELNLQRSGEVLLQDCETGRRRRVRLTKALNRSYREAFRAHSAALEAYARRHRAFYAQARTDQAIEEIILGTLRSERLLR